VNANKKKKKQTLLVNTNEKTIMVVNQW